MPDTPINRQSPNNCKICIAGVMLVFIPHGIHQPYPGFTRPFEFTYTAVSYKPFVLLFDVASAAWMDDPFVGFGKQLLSSNLVLGYQSVSFP